MKSETLPVPNFNNHNNGIIPNADYELYKLNFYLHCMCNNYVYREKDFLSCILYLYYICILPERGLCVK